MDTVLGSAGAVAKLFLLIAGLLVTLFLLAIIQLGKDKRLSKKEKVLFGLTTPTFILISVLISKLTGDGDIIGLVAVGLIIVNVIYLLNPINAYAINLIYTGDKQVLRKGIYGFIALFTAFFCVIAIFTMIILIVR